MFFKERYGTALQPSVLELHSTYIVFTLRSSTLTPELDWWLRHNVIICDHHLINFNLTLTWLNKSLHLFRMSIADKITHKKIKLQSIRKILIFLRHYQILINKSTLFWCNQVIYKHCATWHEQQTKTGNTVCNHCRMLNLLFLRYSRMYVRQPWM